MVCVVGVGSVGSIGVREEIKKYISSPLDLSGKEEAGSGERGEIIDLIFYYRRC
ncbi:MAG: hypothetical protein AB4080_17835 [Trichodesmium sp.]